MLAGTAVNEPVEMNITVDSVLLKYRNPVVWDSWYFVTSRYLGPEYDPVRFVLFAHDHESDEWRVAGSSSHWKFYSGVVFFHTYYPTSVERGHPEIFNVYRGKPEAELVAGLIATIAYCTMGLLGALHKEHLAIYVYCGQSVARILSCISLMEPSHMIGCVLHGLIALVHVGVLCLVSRDIWTLSVMLVGSGLIFVSLLVSPFDSVGTPPPTTTLRRIGLPYLSGAVALELFRRATAALALALVARDKQRYDRAWETVLGEDSPPLGTDGLAAIRLAAERLQGRAAADGHRAFQACCSRCTGRSSGGGGALLAPSVPRARHVATMLTTLYEQVHTYNFLTFSSPVVPFPLTQG